MFTYNASRHQNQKIAAENALRLCMAKGVTETTLGDMATAAGLARGEIPQPAAPLPGCKVAGAGAQGPPGLVGRVGSGCRWGTQHGFP